MTLRPFFSFYGGKWRDALKHYPPPTHSSIVEPFAGSAGYSLRYAGASVTLCEIDPVIAAVWRYLIAVKPSEIRALPDFDEDVETVDDLQIPEEARLLIGFWLNRGGVRSKKSPSRWMRDGIRPGSFWGERVRETIASQVDAIKHWRIIEGSYELCSSTAEATWFVDPPYQLAGQHYRFSSGQIDFVELAEWCRSRPGQVIVCENEGADWLPFEELGDVKTTRRGKRSSEVVWVREQPAVTALFVRRDGLYPKLLDDWWDEERDATTYRGSNPVVLHPPCKRWGRFWSTDGSTEPGNDGGLFDFALDTLIACGGVLEHPAHSYAWTAFDLPRPELGRWVTTGDDLWTTEVYQRNYGHRALKRTWLAYFGARKPPELDWSSPEPPEAYLSPPGRCSKARPRRRCSCIRCQEHFGDEWIGRAPFRRMAARENQTTPEAFARLLISLAIWSR